jgi:hypothetical protein
MIQTSYLTGELDSMDFDAKESLNLSSVRSKQIMKILKKYQNFDISSFDFIRIQLECFTLVLTRIFVTPFLELQPFN